MLAYLEITQLNSRVQTDYFLLQLLHLSSIALCLTLHLCLTITKSFLKLRGSLAASLQLGF